MEKMPSPEEKLETEISGLIARIEIVISEVLPTHPELQDAWYDVEMEGRVGLDRVHAKNNLAAFLEMLEGMRGK